MRTWLLTTLAIASATAVLLPLGACGDGDVPPPFRASAAANGGSTSGAVVQADAAVATLPPRGPLAIDAAASIDVFAARGVALQAGLSGGAGPYRISWKQTAGPDVTVTDGDTLNPTFTAPAVAVAVDLTLTMSVVDATSAPASSTVVVHVHPTEVVAAPAAALSASAGTDQIVHAGARVALGGAAFGGSPAYTFAWTQKGGTPIAIEGVAGPNPKLKAAAVAVDEQASFELVVNDAKGASTTDTVTITVKAPVADAAGPEGLGAGFRPLTLAERTVVTCEGEGCLPGGAQVVCDERAPFALTSIDFNGVGGVLLRKRCVDNAMCLKSWWRETTELDLCVTLLPPTSAPLEPVQSGGVATSCKFCCVGEDCNAGVLPALATTTTCDHDVCYPAR